MSRYKNILKGGALFGALLISALPVFAYDQDNTHPALTDEIVDFYNLNFPDKKLTEQEKQWLIKGSIDEDSSARSLFHFYDPVYNRGVFALASSKDWTLKNDVQKDFYNRQLAGLVSLGDQDSEGDFSYDRALKDYAKGDRKRALVAFGHTLHLLEDAGVPDHTRNDPHPAFVHGQESPYEHEMSKWNPGNFQVARKLWLTKEKPVDLNNVAEYFDKIAIFSNNNFLSKDTISNKEYSLPKLSSIRKINIGGADLAFMFNKDKKGKDYPLALVEEKNGIVRISLVTPEIGSQILDGYWERLSPEIVKNGAGALRLFLEEAEKAKEEYANKPQKLSLWAELLSVFGIGDTSDNINDSEKASVDNNDNPDTLVTDGNTDSVTKTLPLVSPILSPLPKVSPTMSPKPSVTPKMSPTPAPVSNLSTTEKININTANKELLMTLKGIKDAKSDAIILHRQTYGPFQKIEDVMNVSGIGQATFNDIKDFITVGDIVPTPTPVPAYSGGGGGGGGSSTPTPTPTPSPTPEVTPSPSPTPEPEPAGDDVTVGTVVINEIGWMGTATSSFDEWIELYNITDQPININGWTLKSQDNTPDITLFGTIASFGYYLLERTDDTTISDISADQIYTGALSDSGEYLELKDIAGEVIDSVDSSVGWLAGDNNSKSSMERVDPEGLGSDSANWGTNDGVTKNGQDSSGSPINGTPKNQNSTFSVGGSGGDADEGAAVSLISNSWAIWGGNPYHTGYFPTLAGPAVSATKSWEFIVESEAVTQPVLAESGDVVFGASNGSSGRIIKLDENGLEQWEYNTGVSIGTPAILSDGKVYFGRVGAGGSNTFTALNSDGSNFWDFDTGSVGKVNISADGTAYFTTNLNPNSRLQTLSPAGNLEIEKISSGLYSFSPVILEDGTIVTVRHPNGGNQFFIAYSADGAELWNLPYTGAAGSMPSDPSYDQPNGKIYSAVASKLLEVDSAGTSINVITVAPWDYFATTMVAIGPDMLFAGFNNINPASGSQLLAINKTDLSVAWSFEVDSRINPQIDVDQNGNVYFSTQNGTLYSVSSTGSENWKIESGTPSTISPVLTENGLIWGYGDRVVGIRP